MVDALEDLTPFGPSCFLVNQEVGQVDMSLSIREDIGAIPLQLEILDDQMEFVIIPL